MKCVPQGAIQTLDELLSYTEKTVWHVSRQFNSCKAEIITGYHGVKKSGYAWYEYNQDNMYCLKSSLVDANIPLNSYNDWYLFGKIEDAKAYLEAKS